MDWNYYIKSVPAVSITDEARDSRIYTVNRRRYYCGGRCHLLETNLGRIEIVYVKRPKNALSHGVYSSDIVLPWENEQQFNDLHQALREEYYPDGVSEEAAVLSWRACTGSDAG